MLMRILLVVGLIGPTSYLWADHSSIPDAAYSLAEEAEEFQTYLRQRGFFYNIAEDSGRLHMAASALYHLVSRNPASRQIPSYYYPIETDYLRLTQSYLGAKPYDVDASFENHFQRIRQAMDGLDYLVNTVSRGNP